MKKILFAVNIVFLALNLANAKPDEGMWVPMLLKELNEQDMQKNGLKLTAEDIYNINKSSIKDAIVQFGGGCTAEIISKDGLLLTNHHCGYGVIQSHSSVQNDYLTNGFWAMSKEEELRNPGLTATFIVRMEDVTQKVLASVANLDSKEVSRDDMIKEACEKIKDEAIKNTHYEAFIKPFYFGNEYYMFITETFKDIRFVGAPPSSIGKFGGDTDNWMWPRHTGDFSIFRIYAGADNKPAEYAPENKPYHPKYHLTISLDGIEKDDFTMIMGFPGRTQQYLTSYAVNFIATVSNPTRVKIRDERLAIMDADMKANDEVRIKYAAKYAYISNYHKKWIGETRGLMRMGAIEKKREQEEEFLTWVNSDQITKIKYGSLMEEYKNNYASLEKVAYCRDYYLDAIFGIEILNYANKYIKFVETYLNPNSTNEDINSEWTKLNDFSQKHFKDYNVLTDKKIFAKMLSMYRENVDKEFQPFVLNQAEKKYKGNYEKWADDLFKTSFMTSEEKSKNVLENLNKKTLNKITKDPAFLVMQSLMKNFSDDVATVYDNIFEDISRLNRIYVEAQRSWNKSKKFYPDANSTMRLSYGKVAEYVPNDGVTYNYFTTLDGIIEKANPNHEDFIVPEKLFALHANKDYGPYADNGNMKVCFIASNHITGGNSGSPIMNASGELVGCVFDMNWEGVMSDIMYDPQTVRSIAVDIRYVLFIIDKFAGAKYLIDEMTISDKPEVHN